MQREFLEICLFTLAATLAALIAARLLQLDRMLARRAILRSSLPEPGRAADEVVALAYAARSGGLAALGSACRIQCGLLAHGLSLLPTATDGERFRRELHEKLDQSLARRPGRIARVLAGSLSMMGLASLCGALAILLDHMDDPTTASAGVSVAALALLVVGSVIHQLSRPIAEAARAPLAQELLSGLILIEGLNAIRDGGDAALVRERIGALLPEGMPDVPLARAAA